VLCHKTAKPLAQRPRPCGHGVRFPRTVDGSRRSAETLREPVEERRPVRKPIDALVLRRSHRIQKIECPMVGEEERSRTLYALQHESKITLEIRFDKLHLVL